MPNTEFKVSKIRKFRLRIFLWCGTEPPVAWLRLTGASWRLPWQMKNLKTPVWCNVLVYMSVHAAKSAGLMWGAPFLEFVAHWDTAVHESSPCWHSTLSLAPRSIDYWRPRMFDISAPVGKFKRQAIWNSTHGHRWKLKFSEWRVQNFTWHGWYVAWLFSSSWNNRTAKSN